MEAYFDIFSGISGNMILGALLDLGLDKELLSRELSKLGLDDEYELKIDRVTKNGIGATFVDVGLHSEHSQGGREAHHSAGGRTLPDIKQLIKGSSLQSAIKEQSIAIFEKLARAEAKIHETSPHKIHFHEVGATDAIVDIVGSVIGIYHLGITEVTASPLHTGTGFLKCAHGIMPVPAPATMELLQGIPQYSTGIKKELVTPTGAAIITTIADTFDHRPGMVIEKTGYGAGSYQLDIPNVLRLNLFARDSVNSAVRDNNIFENVELLSVNIDDMNPEFYDYIRKRLFAAGALDVYFVPLQMKKNRPGTEINVLTVAEKRSCLVDIILEETTTLGLRIFSGIERVCLERRQDDVKTEWGSITVKVGIRKGQVINIAPEYEDCCRIAKEQQLPLKNVYEAAKREWDVQYNIKSE